MSADRLFQALADPTRRDLLRYLAEQSPKTATDLAPRYAMTRQALLKHLALLEQARLVKVTPHGRERRYTLTPEPLNDVEDWVRDLNACWQGRLQRLKAFVEQNDNL